MKVNLVRVVEFTVTDKTTELKLDSVTFAQVSQNIGTMKKTNGISFQTWVA